MDKTINIAILGLGTVGGGTYEILTKNREKIRAAEGVTIAVKKVLDLNAARIRELGIAAEAVAKSPDEIMSDPDISIVVEVIGGTGVAKAFILDALRAGKTVVTANKELVAKCWPELEAAAKASGAGLYFEASCGGGIPVIRTLKESLQGDNITAVTGIINGTTNYILSKMSEEELSYEAALKDAQSLGFAEADPTADVDGYDAAYKLSILSSLAFHTCIPYTAVCREGIRGITAADIRSGREMGYTVKLLAIGRRSGNRVEARVHPALIKTEHPLAAVRDSYNAVYLTGDFVENVMLFGRGAGARPTGSAIVSDIVYAARRETHAYSDFVNDGKVAAQIEIVSDFGCAYYLALTVEDRPGVLGAIADVLGREKISIKTLNQRSGDGVRASIVIMTHATTEQAMQTALKSIAALPAVKRADNLIRVIE
jgi:homoserine dehydrogenase